MSLKMSYETLNLIVILLTHDASAARNSLSLSNLLISL